MDEGTRISYKKFGEILEGDGVGVNMMLNYKIFFKTLCLVVFVLFLVTSATAQWISIGPEGGAVISFVHHPTEPDIVYAGCDDSGGLYKTIDGGDNWTLITSSMSDLTAWCLAMDPQNPNILYAGDHYARYGVVKTADEGNTWAEVNSGLNNLHIGSLAVNPSNSDVVYAGTGSWQFSGDGVYKSINSASSWFQSGLSGMQIHCLAIDPQYPETLYAGTGGNGIYKSTNGGANWFQMGFTNSGILCMAINPDSANVIYATVLGDTCGVYKSVDGAQTWNLTGVYSTIPWNVVMDPNNTQILYVTTITEGVYKSTNGGVGWNQINSGLTSLFCVGVCVSPIVPNTVYLGSFIEGIYKSTDGGDNWSKANSGFNNTYVRALAIDQNSPYVMYAGLNAGYQPDLQYTVRRTTDNGVNWQTCGNFRIDVFSLAVDPESSSILYAGTYLEGVYRCSDGGTNWSPTAGWSDTAVIFSIEFHPNSSDTQYVGAWTPSDPWGVYRSVDRGLSWQPLGLPGKVVVPVAIDPYNTNVLYAGTIFPDSGVYKSTDSGNNWFQTGLDSGSVWSLAVDPLSSNILYAGLRDGKLYKSVDAGSVWTQIDPGWTNTNILSLAVNPTNTDIIYAGTSGAEKETAATGGIYQSTDGGNNWTDISSGLTTTHSLCLTIHPASPDAVYTGTYGGGVYVFQNAGIREDKILCGIPQKSISVEACPNPFSKLTTISFENVHSAKGIELKIYDATGRLVKQFLLPTSYYLVPTAVEWDGTDNSGKKVATGIYFCELEVNNSKTGRKLILLQ